MKTKCLNREDWDTDEREQKDVEARTGWTERDILLAFISLFMD